MRFVRIAMQFNKLILFEYKSVLLFYPGFKREDIYAYVYY